MAYLTFYGHDAITVAQGTNRLPEVREDGGPVWKETQIWKCKAIADRRPNDVRLKGYTTTLMKSASAEARALIEARM